MHHHIVAKLSADVRFLNFYSYFCPVMQFGLVDLGYRGRGDWYWIKLLKTLIYGPSFFRLKNVLNYAIRHFLGLIL